MAIKWDIAVPAIATVVGAIVGGVICRIEKRARLIAYYGHTSAFWLPPPKDHPPNQPPPSVHTHSVVIRNVGRKTATNVRVSHYSLPEAFTLFPAMPYTLQPVPAAGDDIVIPTLVPGQQVTINYLYYPPLLFNQVTSGVRSDEGFARVVTALLTPQSRAWKLWGARALMVLGLMAVLYVAFAAIKAVV
jgi:hypothetical protein